MHYSVLVLIPEADLPVEDMVAAMLAPFNKNQHEEGHWDWYQIGGRWTGRLSGYDPQADPDNIETCHLCNGTGERPGGREQFGDEWYEWCHGCNGCQGKGTAIKWPNQWKHHEGDIMPVDKLPVDVTAFAVVYPTREGPVWQPREVWDRDVKKRQEDPEWQERTLPGILGMYRDHVAVMVDCHN